MAKQNTPRRQVVICGAAGRDYHNFNCVYRDEPSANVVAFTATQIPGIADRRYPPSLAGPLYPKGIPIVAESCLEELIQKHSVDDVVFAYSDIRHNDVMHLASRALAAGANFTLLGSTHTQIEASKPVIAVSAVRTGCGKSQVARHLSKALADAGIAVAALRHPMPYGQLDKQALQRFDDLAGLDKANCTIEEREEYEPHIRAGTTVFAGVDYQEITTEAQKEADLIIWDGGNNDLPFLQPDFHIVLVDALRPHQLVTHHPGEAVLRSADLVIINKIDNASTQTMNELEANLAQLIPDVPILRAYSPITLSQQPPPGARILIVEDGPTITHGGMATGAGWQAVQGLNCEILDPRDHATPALRAVYAQWPHIRKVLPAMGYGDKQLNELSKTIDAAGADFVIAGTPIDLARVADISTPVIQASYSYRDASSPSLLDALQPMLQGVAKNTVSPDDSGAKRS